MTYKLISHTASQSPAILAALAVPGATTWFIADGLRSGEPERFDSLEDLSAAASGRGLHNYPLTVSECIATDQRASGRFVVGRHEIVVD